MQKLCVLRTKCVLSCLLAIIGSLVPATSHASQDPATLPLLKFADLEYIGGFRVPDTSNGDDFSFAGLPVAFNPANNSLFIGTRSGKVAELSIPKAVNTSTVAQMPFASYLQAFADPTEGHMSLVASDGAAMSGLLVQGNRLYGTSSIYYDANNTQVVSHFSHSTNLSSSSFTGMAQVWETGKAGFVAGYMATVPAEWQSTLGGSAITGQCCIPVVWRTSWGPSAFAFNPAQVGNGNSVAAAPLLYYPAEHSTLGPWLGSNPTYGGTISMGGVAVIAGTRTAIYVGRNGTGPFCYGNGTSTQSLAGTLASDGEPYCYDPTNSDKGQHAYPYRYQIWAYDLKELAAVKAGLKQPWEVVPYGVWPFDLPTAEPSVRMGGLGYDAANQILYMSQMLADQDGYAYRPIIHAVRIKAISAGPAIAASAVELSADVTAPKPAGTSITWTASVVGGASKFQYKWFTYGFGSWTPVTDWTDNQRFTWTPTAAIPDARVGVWVRSAGSSSDTFELTANVEFPIGADPSGQLTGVLLTANNVAPQPSGSTITFTASPVGTVAPVLYKWWIYDGAWTTVSGWTSANTFALTPHSNNPDYRIGVWVKRAINPADALEAAAEHPLPIGGGQ